MAQHDPPDQVEIDGLRVPGGGPNTTWIGLAGIILLLLAFIGLILWKVYF